MAEEYINEHERPVTRGELADFRRECQNEVNKTREEVYNLRRELDRKGIPVEVVSPMLRWMGQGFPY